ncbi:MAG: uridine kinase [Bacteroidia bacterium]|nr:uridine kinase [Bacteroidia bacterium]
MNRPFIIGITGGSGSGKTSLIRKLKHAFDEQSITVLSQDDYYVPIEDQYIDAHGVHNFDLPSAINIVEFVRDIKLLQQGNPVTRKEYVFNNDSASAKTLYFEPSKILVVEGLFLLHVPEIVAQLNVSIFVHARDDQKISRRIVRDQIERNYPLEDVLYRYEHHVMPSYMEFILPYKDKADIVINNDDSFDNAFELLRGFIQHKLDA